MKKLFITGLSALMLLGVAGCGASYSDAVLSGEADGYTFHAVGGWGEWEAKDGNKMTATSVKAVSEFSKDLADKLSKKSLKYLYVMTIKTTDASWGADDPKAKVNGEVKTFPGGCTVKCIRATWNKEESTYVNDQWIPNPADTSPAHMEALTDNLWVSPYQKDLDPDGFSWADNPVVTSGVGSYHFVVAQYTATSSESVVGYGFGLVPVVLK